MKNGTFYKEVNGILMIKSTPLCWQTAPKYADGTGPLYYSIYAGDFGGGWMCIYKEKEKELSMGKVMTEDSVLRFKVESLQSAGEIVLKLFKGMNITYKDTIYEKPGNSILQVEQQD